MEKHNEVNPSSEHLNIIPFQSGITRVQGVGDGAKDQGNLRLFVADENEEVKESKTKNGKTAAVPKKTYRCKMRNEWKYVSEAERSQLIQLISNEGMSCYKAAKKLKIPYSNAKKIYKKAILRS